MPLAPPTNRSAHAVTRRLLYAASTLSLVLPASAWAQSAQLGAASASHSFAIPAQPLEAALLEYMQQSGVQVGYESADVAGRTSAAVNGAFGPGEALSRLLSGAGLTYRFTAPTAVRLEPAPTADAGAVQLGPVRVEGTAEGSQTSGGSTDSQRPAGPGVGYVATRSVAGTKTDTPMIEAPQSISVVTRAQMDDQGAQSLVDALRYTAGTVVSPRGTTSTDVVYLRGFGDQEGGTQYLDGLKLIYGTGFAQPQIDPSGLERVEVLRGPASVLFGQNSPGGIVNMVSKRPAADQVQELQFRGGSYNNFEGSFDIGGAVDADQHLLIRLNGLARTNDTQFPFNKQRRYTISPTITWAPATDTTLTLLGNYQRDDPGGRYYNLVPAYGSVLPNPNGKISSRFSDGDPNYDEYKRTQYSLGYAFEHKFSPDLIVRQNLRYQHINGTYRDVFSAGIAADLRTLSRFTRSNFASLNSLAIDTQFEAHVATGPLTHTLLAGFDYRGNRDRETIGLGFLNIPSLDLFDPVYGQASFSDPTLLIVNSTQHIHQYGLYAQDQISLDNWRFTVGVRQDWADSDTLSHSSGATTHMKSDKATFRAGLVYLADNGLAPYVSYSTSFLPTSGTDFFGTPFKPTTGEQYEGGIRYQPPGIDAYITASAYHLVQYNVLTPDPDSTHIGFNVQTGAIRSQGIELEARANINASVHLVASYTYTDAKVTQSNTSNLGQRPLYIPKNSASLWVSYDLPDTLKGAHVGGGVRYFGSTAGTTAPTALDPNNRTVLSILRVPSYTLFDAQLAYDLDAFGLKGWRVGVTAQNLFDKSYVVGCGSQLACYYGARRTVLGSLRYRW